MGMRKGLTEIKNALPDMPGWSKVWVGSIYPNPPEEMIYDVDITKADLIRKARNGELINLPIVHEHQHALVFGKSVQSAIDVDSGTPWVFFRIRLDTKERQDLNAGVASGQYRGLSASHDRFTGEFKEISIVKDPRRKGSFIIEAGEGGSGAEHWAAASSATYTPQFIISENVFNQKYKPSAALVYQSSAANISSSSDSNIKMPVTQSVTLTGDGTTVGGTQSGVPGPAGLPVAPSVTPMLDSAPAGTGVSHPRLPVAPPSNSQNPFNPTNAPSYDRPQQNSDYDGNSRRRDNYQNDQREYEPRNNRRNQRDQNDSQRRQRNSGNTNNRNRQQTNGREYEARQVSNGNGSDTEDQEPGSRVRASNVRHSRDQGDHDLSDGDEEEAPRYNKRVSNDRDRESYERGAPRRKVATSKLPASASEGLQRAHEQFEALMNNEAIPKEKRDRFRAALSNATPDTTETNAKLSAAQAEIAKLKAERQAVETKAAIESLTASLADMSGSEVKKDEIDELQKMADAARAEPNTLIQMSNLIKTVSKRLKPRTTAAAAAAPVEEKEGFKEFAQMVGVSVPAAAGASDPVTAAMPAPSNALPIVKVDHRSDLVQMSALIAQPAKLLANQTACQKLTDAFIAGATTSRLARVYNDPSSKLGFSFREPQVIR